MNNTSNSQVKIELIWWLITTLVVVAILLPIYNNVENFPFWLTSIGFIIVFITITRYIFLLKFTFLAHWEKAKIVIGVLCILLIFFIITALSDYHIFVEEFGLESLLTEYSLRGQDEMTAYIHLIMTFFGTGALIAAIAFPFRLVISVWRGRNRGTV